MCNKSVINISTTSLYDTYLSIEAIPRVRIQKPLQTDCLSEPLE